MLACSPPSCAPVWCATTGLQRERPVRCHSAWPLSAFPSARPRASGCQGGGCVRGRSPQRLRHHERRPVDMGGLELGAVWDRVHCLQPNSHAGENSERQAYDRGSCRGGTHTGPDCGRGGLLLGLQCRYVDVVSVGRFSDCVLDVSTEANGWH